MFDNIEVSLARFDTVHGNKNKLNHRFEQKLQ